MFLLEWLPKSLLFFFLVTSMLSIGMQTSKNDLRALLESRPRLIPLLIVNFVAVPLIGVFMARTVSQNPQVAVAFLLLACTPGGLSALQFTTKLKGSALFAGSSAFILSVLAVCISPFLLEIVLPKDIQVVVPYGRALFCILFLLLAPIVVGMVIRQRVPAMADRLSKPIALAGTVAFVVVVFLLMGFRKEAMHEIGGANVLKMLIFIVITMIAGWLAGGRQNELRPIFATITGMRNVALCLLIVLETFPDPTMQTPLVAFSALMVPPNMLYTIYFVIRSKKAEKTDTN